MVAEIISQALNGVVIGLLYSLIALAVGAGLVPALLISMSTGALIGVNTFQLRSRPNIVMGNAPYVFVDTSAPSGGMRLYRVVTLADGRIVADVPAREAVHG